MTILKNVEIWHPKLTRPSDKFDKLNPRWEVQIRTKDPDVKDEWKKLGLNVKKIAPDEGDPYWRVNLKKRTKNRQGESSRPIKVVDGKMRPLDGDTIGNGSIANVRILQKEYEKPEGGGKGISSTLMGVQVTRLVPYVYQGMEDFTEEEFSTEGESEDDIPF
jgi:hypothetical protein